MQPAGARMQRRARWKGRGECNGGVLDGATGMAECLEECGRDEDVAGSDGGERHAALYPLRGRRERVWRRPSMAEGGRRVFSVDCAARCASHDATLDCEHRRGDWPKHAAALPGTCDSALANLYARDDRWAVSRAVTRAIRVRLCA